MMLQNLLKNIKQSSKIGKSVQEHESQNNRVLSHGDYFNKEKDKLEEHFIKE